MSPIPAPLPMIAVLLVAFLLATPLVMWRGRVSFAQAGWRPGGLRAVLLGVGWGGLLAAGGVAWLRFLLHTGNYLPIPIAPTWGDWAIWLLAVPVVEEFFFRGAVFAALQQGWRPFWAVVLSALLYTLPHPEQPWLAFLFLCGLGYALAFRGARSLTAPLLAHMLVVAALILARIHPAAVHALPPHSLTIAALGALALLGAGAMTRDNRP